jgi:hypothetical protein
MDGKKSERIIRRLLVAWLLLFGGVLLTQWHPFPGSMRLGYWLLVAVALGSPVVALLMLWLLGARLRELGYRVRVLRRAAKWKRKEPPTTWFEQE